MPLHVVTGPAGEAYPALHIQGDGCSGPPAHDIPATQTEHVPSVPRHELEVVAFEK